MARCSMQTRALGALCFLLCQIPWTTTRAQRSYVGVPIERRSLYEPTSDLQFRCLDGSGTIPFDYVNDDYCDCHDSSDEPGTAACPNGVYYCANRGYVERYIPSGLVNDGLCDCCDGSDEYNTTAQCSDNCDQLGEQLRQENERIRAVAEQGAAKRSQYKKEAKQKHQEDQQQLSVLKQELSDKEQAIRDLEGKIGADYGPDRVFMPLRGKCFTHEDREYTYSFCPFERATQESTTGMQTELGRWGSWTGPSDNLYAMQKYEGGYQCWNGPARSVLVNLQCGADDRLVSVSEPARCEYQYEFATPAACPDLDPPEEESNSASSESAPTTDGTTEDAITDGATDGVVEEEDPGLQNDESYFESPDLEREDLDLETGANDFNEPEDEHQGERHDEL